MSAKQFQHFMQFHKQLARLQQVKRAKANVVGQVSSPAVAAAKDWLAGASRRRPYLASL